MPMIRFSFGITLSALTLSILLPGCYESFVHEPDGSVPPVSCAEDEFTCASDDCVPRALVCDRIPHCVDGSDEAPANADCGDPCGPPELRCLNGAYIPASLACDGVFDCADGSDEATINPTCELMLCVDDHLEENDCAEEAAVVVPVSTGIAAQICPWDYDHYRLDAFGGGTLTIAIRFEHDRGDLDLRLMNPDGLVVASSISGTDDEEVIWEIADDALGAYTFMVHGYRGAQNAYVIDIDFSAAAP